ncbi:efflux RND transporter periplasmic adaptor subunit [Planctomycetota bacterium]
MGNYKNKHKRANPKGQQYTAGFISFKWLIILIFVIAAAGTVFGPTFLKKMGSNPSDENISTFTVRRDDLIITVSEGGSIKARNTIEVKNLVDQREITILDIVPEGTTITEEDFKNGKVLVTLESSSIKDDLTQREMDFASVEASLVQAQEAYYIQVNQNESDIASAELSVKWALMDLQKYTGEELAVTIVEDANRGISLTENYIDSLIQDADSLKNCGAGQALQKLQDSIDVSADQLLQAQNQLDGTIKLNDAKYISDIELERDRLSVKTKQISKESNELALELFKLYDFPKQIEKFLSDYMEAKRKLERTNAQARSRLAQKESDRRRSESNFSSRQERLEKSRKDLERCIIKTPAPGLVIYGSGTDDHRRYRGMGIIGPGETVYREQTLITLPDLTKLMAEISVHEVSVDKVKPGQRAKIILDAFPDLTLTGEVLKVAPLPDQSAGWFNPDLKVYKTQVAIDGAHDFVKPGMSARAEILVNHIKDALIVPNHVVSNRLGKKVCYVPTSRGTQQQEVQTGQYNDAFVQILSGLQAGEKVLLNPPTLTETEAGAANGFEEEINGQAGQEEKGAPTETQDRQERPEDKEFDITKIELTDEMADRMMSNLSQRNPEKAEELKELQQSDPDKFKAELRKLMQEQMRTFRQGEGGERRQGGSDDMRRQGGGLQQRGGSDGTGQRGGGGMGRGGGGDNMGRRQDSD